MTFRTLLPKLSDAGTRRSGWLRDHDDPDQVRFQVGAKVLTSDSENEVLQLKVWVHGTWIEVMLNEAGDIVAYAVAATEKDAWKAALAVLRRKEYVFA